jgi:hypothetical protein
MKVKFENFSEIHRNLIQRFVKWNEEMRNIQYSTSLGSKNDSLIKEIHKWVVPILPAQLPTANAWQAYERTCQRNANSVILYRGKTDRTKQKVLQI